MSSEYLTEAEREALADACDAGRDFGETWIRFVRNGDESMLLPVVEWIIAAREAERDALAAAVDRVRRRHPRGDEESGLLATGKWCPTCGHERSENGYGACPDRAALSDPSP